MESVDFSKERLEEEYEQVVFSNCHFSGVDLTSIKFIDCEFNGCDLSLVELQNTAFQDVRFMNCKMLGLHFDRCNPFLFEVTFTNCQLNHSSFFQCKLAQSNFKNCLLHEVDFAEADLTEATFSECDLTGSQFQNTNLEKADLTTAINFIIHPDQNSIRQARFSYPAVLGLLQHFNIEIQ